MSDLFHATDDELAHWVEAIGPTWQDRLVGEEIARRLRTRTAHNIGGLLLRGLAFWLATLIATIFAATYAVNHWVIPAAMGCAR